MAGLLDGIDQKTQMAGQNRLELLLFTLKGCQKFGINVFKVKEVVQCPPLSEMPGSNPVIRGVAILRGEKISVMDLSQAIGGPVMGKPEEHFLIVTEYNRSTLGFLVGGVERIINMNWENVLPPPKGLGRDTYMTAVTKVDEELVEIIDVEKVLSEVLGVDDTITHPLDDSGAELDALKVLVVDDSVVARKQVESVLNEIGIASVLVKDGQEALVQLEEWKKQGPVSNWLAMVISDIEMPKMDGYSLVTAIRKDPKLADLFVIMHSSLSGVFNENMVNKVGADHFLAKFKADDLASMVTTRLKALA